MRVGLVLGAGGVVGAAYHAGALTAIQQDLGWDPRRADIIVGTSAGALVGAVLRTGVPATDLAAWTVGAPLSPDGYPIAEALRPEFDPVSLAMFLRLPRLPHRDAFWTSLRHPLRFDPMRAWMTNIGDGERALAPHVEFLGEGWPADDLYLCAVRRRDGTRRVFGRTSIPNDGLTAAVAASCAVPGYFEPVRVDGEQYLDGGLKSPTNADTLRDRDLDVVIALSPMSTSTTLPRYSLERVLRDRVGLQLRRELSMLEARGTRTVVLEPGEEVLSHITSDFMNEEHAHEVVAAAFLETGQQLRATNRAHDLAPLRAHDRHVA